MTCRFTNSSQMASGRLAHVLLTNNTAVSNWHLSLRPYYIYLRVHCLSLRYCPIREIREGWPLRTVETEANGDLKVHKIENFSGSDFEFYYIFYFIVSYAQILRFCKQHFLIRPLLGEIQLFRVV